MSEAAGRPHRLLFVCTGNVCRSPMAEVLARAHAGATAVDVDVRSASTLGWDGEPAEPGMVAVAAELDLDLGGHRSQPLTDELVAWADYVLVMELAHHAHIAEHHPAGRTKVELLARFGGGGDEIADPIGAWFRFRYRRCRDELRRCVHAFIDRLPSERA